MAKELEKLVDKINMMINCRIGLYHGFPVGETVSAGAENGIDE